MHPVLRLYEDVLRAPRTSNSSCRRCRASSSWCMAPATIDGKAVSEGEAWQGEGAALVRPGTGGVTCWRWELSRGDQGSTVASAPGMITHEKLTAFLETLPKGELLMRGDSVAFPPGGCRLYAPASRAGHPLLDRGRHPHRHPWPLDLATDQAAPGTRPDATRCSRKRRWIGQAASFA